MKAFKFLIPPNGPWRDIPDPEREAAGLPLMQARGYFAVVLAETVEEAKQRFVEVSRRDGDFYAWIEVADVQVLDVVSGAVLIRGAF